MLPDTSLAVQVTVVSPIGNVEPEAGEHLTVGEQPLAGGLLKATTAPAGVTAAAVIVDGHEMVGGTWLTTVTVAVHELVAPW